MSEDTKQTATEDTDTSAQPDVKEKGAPEKETDDFDKDLAEFAKETEKPSSEQPKSQQPQGDDEAVKRAAAKIRAEIDADRKEADFYKQVQEGLNLPEKIVKAYAKDRVLNDPALLKAYLEGGPKLFQGMVKKIQEELLAPYKTRPDADATDTREAVADAVQRGSGRPPESKAPDFKDKSNAEYRDEVKKQYGYTPRV